MDRRGISPVIATVIIVAVTIAVSIAVAYWMGGLASFFTRFEKIEIGSAYATYDSDAGFHYQTF
jgi:flagellin-like protein